jgi:hypothetical protein
MKACAEIEAQLKAGIIDGFSLTPNFNWVKAVGLSQPFQRFQSLAASTHLTRSKALMRILSSPSLDLRFYS